MEASFLEQGITLMLVGMGTVFVFLTLLVGTTLAMSGLVQKFYPITPTAADADDEAADVESKIVAAIAAALTLHKNR